MCFVVYKRVVYVNSLCMVRIPLEYALYNLLAIGIHNPKVISSLSEQTI